MDQKQSTERETPKPLRDADLGDDVRDNAKVAPLGFEPRLTDSESTRIALFPRENVLSHNSAAPGAAVGLDKTSIDADLQAIIERWADLPDAMKAGIMAMVRAADG